MENDITDAGLDLTYSVETYQFDERKEIELIPGFLFSLLIDEQMFILLLLMYFF